MTATRAVLAAVIGFAVVSCSAGKGAVSSGGSVPVGAAAPAPSPTPYERSAETIPAVSADPPVAPTQLASHVDFASQIRPFLETDCAPCHFEGGKMYGPLPFDQGATIRLLGADKMFTRVKDEQKRALIRAFLAEQDPV